MGAVMYPGTCEGPAAPAKNQMDHRFGRRFRCGTVVRLSAGEGTVGQGRLANVSLSGAYLETGLPLPLFAAVEITRAGESLPPIHPRGSVVRRDARGVGIEWCETPGRPICEIFGCTKRCEVV